MGPKQLAGDARSSIRERNLTRLTVICVNHASTVVSVENSFIKNRSARQFGRGVSEENTLKCIKHGCLIILLDVFTPIFTIQSVARFLALNLQTDNSANEQ